MQITQNRSKINTFSVLLAAMCLLALLAILFSPVLWIWKGLLIIAVLSVTVWELRQFSVQHIEIQGNKVLLTENGQIYEADYLPTSVVVRHFCLLHIRCFATGKCWRIPVSRLEFPRESFRQLKCELQRFSMRTI